MSAVTFDTLKLSRKLEKAGFSQEQATGAAEALADAMGDQVATRQDVETAIAPLRAKLDMVQWVVSGIGWCRRCTAGPARLLAHLTGKTPDPKARVGQGRKRGSCVAGWSGLYKSPDAPHLSQCNQILRKDFLWMTQWHRRSLKNRQN